MNKLENALTKISEAMIRELDGGTLEEGESMAFQLNDCVAIFSIEDGCLKTHFIGGKPIPVDASTGFYEEEGGLND